MIYLILGDDLPAVDARISEIKNKFFKDSQEALAFDFDNLDARELGADTLKQAFLTLPVIAPHRLIILRQVHKLKPADIQVLNNFCQKPAKHCDVILESSENTLKGELKDLSLYSKASVLSKPEGPNAFDMAKLITARRSGDALKMLNGLYRENVPALKIMGALVWYWGQEGKQLGKERFKQGLKALEEADFNIKRSRLDPQYAVEKVVVELGLLFRR
jgi:DNA polymerase III delta subunit